MTSGQMIFMTVKRFGLQRIGNRCVKRKTNLNNMNTAALSIGLSLCSNNSQNEYQIEIKISENHFYKDTCEGLDRIIEAS